MNKQSKNSLNTIVIPIRQTILDVSDFCVNYINVALRIYKDITGYNIPDQEIFGKRFCCTLFHFEGTYIRLAISTLRFI